MLDFASQSNLASQEVIVEPGTAYLVLAYAYEPTLLQKYFRFKNSVKSDWALQLNGLG
jgi:hypothetical protein